ncbi:hypothetical protein [Thermoplasma volcanium GSS1]|uniref:Uncharacterized protein n=1 Tax=Thermoplasma volcanium (strain ATCC 51530 / DSM 4299 / JCM 9571 / NBRC 15438 / GSS1) TaxID=273116 RepID=Q97B86_THEVO|nr:DUF790 family protein [Thermoplasma volcanium]BAB59713.1 hypothetical protein [Thermoplasma volcanium GSS1]
MFPLELLVAKKTENGSIRPIVIPPDSKWPAENVIDTFRSSIGLKRRELYERIKDIEYQAKNPKTVRSMALLLERISKFRDSFQVPSSEVRRFLFSLGPAVRPEERHTLVEMAAKHFSVGKQEIEDALYGDIEPEQRLISVPDITPDWLVRNYNLEQIETLIYKAKSMVVKKLSNWLPFIDAIKELGLMFEALNEEGLTVIIDGPNSIFGGMDRYGSALAQAFSLLAGSSSWSISATVSIGGKDYSVQLDQSLNYYLPEKREGMLDKTYPEPINIDGRLYFPSSVMDIDGKKVYVDIVRNDDINRILKRDSKIRASGYNWITVYIGPSKNWSNYPLRFRSKIDWSLVQAYARKTLPKETKADYVMAALSKLYPDIDAIIDFLDSNGLPLSIVEKYGYKVSWNGIVPSIEKS